MTAEQIEILKQDLDIWFEDSQKDSNPEGEWSLQLKEVFKAAYG